MLSPFCQGLSIGWHDFEWDVIRCLINDYLRFYVPLKNISLIWRRHHCRWRAAKFRPMLGAQGLWAGRDRYRATPAVTRDLGFSGLIRRTAQFSRLLRRTRGCGGSILTRILTGVDVWRTMTDSKQIILIRLILYIRIVSIIQTSWCYRDFYSFVGCQRSTCSVSVKII
jgi:hypothetical protein